MTLPAVARSTSGTRLGTAALLLAGAGGGALMAVLYRYNPLQVGFYPRCPLYVLTGIYCPGCGALRATHELLHGHVFTALGYNAVYVITLPFLVYVVAASLAQRFAGRPVLPTRQLTVWQAKSLFWAMIAFTVLRNLPIYPFNVLAP